MYRRGEIYYVDSYYQTGSEQKAGRPAIIVSNDKNNQYSSTLEVVYLTTRPKNDLPTHVKINSCTYESLALCEQITTVSVDRIGDLKGRCTDEEMEQIDKAIMVSCGIDFENNLEPEETNESGDNGKLYELNNIIVELREQLMLERGKCNAYEQLYREQLHIFTRNLSEKASAD